jgi:TPR repeat protein
LEATANFGITIAWWARVVGTTKVADGLGGSINLPMLDYGQVAQLTEAEERALAKVRAGSPDASENKRAVLMANAIAGYERQAANGNADAEERLGEIYRDGEGVEKDPAKARDWFAKSAAQGNKDAIRALERMNAVQP